MKWTIDEIRTLLDVIDTGTVSGAAARSNLSKSVVSKRVSDLEAALGAALFRRHAGRIAPTDAGIELARRLRPALAELTLAVEGVVPAGEELRGTLALTAPMSFGIRHLGPVIAAFARDHPDLRITLAYDDRMLDLAGAGFDLALRIGNLPDSGLMARRICEDPRVVCASPGYVARNGAPETLAELQAHPCIGYLNRQATQLWQFRGDGGETRSVAMTGRIAANNGEAMRDMAIAGLGLALLPRFIVHDAIADGRLVEAAPSLVPVPLPVSLVWPPLRPLPPKLRAIIDHLGAAFAGGRPWMRGD